MSRRLGTAINNNYNNTQLTLNSRLAAANTGGDSFFSGDLNKVVELITPEMQLEQSQVTGLTDALNSKLNLAGGTLTGPLVLPGDASNPLEAVPLTQLQASIASLQAGFIAKDPCSEGTTANLNATYNNGTSGTGATLTANSNGVFSTDGVTPVVGSRIFVLAQTNAAQNGIYVLTNAGSVSTPYVLTRATDYDNASEILTGSYAPILNGTTLGGTSYQLTTTGTVTVGTTALNFSPINIINAGTGLTKPTPNTIAIANTGVGAGSKGSASKTVSATVNAQGQLTDLTEQDISITAAQVSDFSSSVSSSVSTAITAQKNAANGIAGLDGNSRINSAQLPYQWVQTLISGNFTISSANHDRITAVNGSTITIPSSGIPQGFYQTFLQTTESLCQFTFDAGVLTVITEVGYKFFGYGSTVTAIYFGDNTWALLGSTKL